MPPGVCQSRRSSLLPILAMALLVAALTLATYGSTAWAQRIYWTDSSGGVLESAAKAGPYVGQLEAVPTGSPTGMAVDPFAGMLYWCNATVVPPGIFRAEIGQPYAVQMVVATPDAQDVALDLSRGHIYWIDRTSDEIARADLGSGLALNRVTVVSGNMEEPRALELDLRNGKIYWTDHDFNWIQRANLDGSGRETVVSGLTADRIESISLDASPTTRLSAPNGRIYWTEHTVGGLNGSSDILRADIASPGGAIPRVTIVNDVPGIIAGLAVDERERKLYWANRSGGDTIWRAELDGSDPVSLIPVEGQPYAVVLDDVFCGNGAQDPNEECDDGNFADRDRCDADCRTECGNGQIDVSPTAGSEGCDDGNLIAGDGCSPACAAEDGWVCPHQPAGTPCHPDCGDGKRVGSEACDDGNEGGTPIGPEDGCSADCSTINGGWSCLPVGAACTPICGDGERKGTEVCDDGNRENCVGSCSADCRTDIVGCGDGVVCGAEECDANPANALTCSADCRSLAHCGDGQIETGVCRPPARTCFTDADCDAAAGYASCDASGRCQEAAGGGNACDTTADCAEHQECYAEPCDDGNAANGDDCINADGVCTLAVCNDGYVRDHPASPGNKEQCDPPDGASCDDLCQAIPRASCRQRLGGLSFAQADGVADRRQRKRRSYTDGASGDEDGRRDGACQFAVNVCLAIPLSTVAGGSNDGCNPVTVRSVDFKGSAPVTVDPADWRAREIQNMSLRVAALGDARVAGRCVDGLKGKQCSLGEDHECDRFLGSDDGKCGAGTGVEFVTPLSFEQRGPHCMTVNVRVTEGERLWLRSRVRGVLSNTGDRLRRDTDHLRLVCRAGEGPLVTATPR